jgi:hypothetical protein
VAWLPTLYFGLIFFAYEKFVEFSVEERSGRMWAAEFVREGLPLPPDLVEEILDDPVGARGAAWRYLLFCFFRAPQAVLLALMVGLVAPSLIARDFRTRAFILYFSRPLSRVGYVAGKASVLWAFCLFMTTLPALTLYFIAVLLSPSFGVLADTWDLPLRVLGASVLFMIPTTVLAMALSSVVTESRYAGFAWFAIWALGALAYRIHQNTWMISSGLGPHEPGETSVWWSLVSLFDTLGRAQEWAFGTGGDLAKVVPILGFLGVLTVVCFAVLFRRISSPMRA